MKSIHLDTERTWRGGQQQMAYLAGGLIERGHDALVLCRPDGACLARLNELGIPARPFAIHGDMDLLAARRLGRLADAWGADIVHAHTARALIPAATCGLFARRALRCVAHRRVNVSLHKLPLRLSGLKYRWGVDRFIAITDVVRNVMVRDGVAAERIAVIHSGTDLRRFEGIVRDGRLRREFGIPEHAPLAGAVGALVPIKGHVHLVEAAARVLRDAPDAWFILLGEGPLRADLERRAEALHVAHRLRMPGFRADIPQCLAELDLLCMPSLGEGLGSVVLEGMALRRPVIAAASGGLTEVVRDGVNGLLTPPRDSAALADAVLKLLRDPALARRLGEEGRRTVEDEFTVPHMVDRTLALYGDLLSR